ncbi:alpha/beta fold hydrolase [Streptomyces sp. SID3343]|uniref:alpha/beta hydrolase family protein n=1 Tax=Streptomyces sp. SID3343 TaxID=2690260 RepID=UPI001F0260FA|nr:alpha/beta fold hydrolase [Streptomyces sp. SID3343]
MVTTRPLRRISWSFSTDGGHAACLATPGDGTWRVESWSLLPGRASGGLPVGTGAGERLHTQLLALPDGRVLVCRHEPGRHDIAILEADEAGSERLLTTVRLPGLRLIPYPGSDALAIALGADTTPSTTVWLVREDGRLDAVAELSGLYSGGVWLDPGGRRLAVDEVRGGRIKTVALDLDTATVRPFLELTDESNDRLLLCDPVGGLLVIASDAPGSDRLGWIRLPADRAQPPGQVRFPEVVHVPDAQIRPIAIAPDGRRVALQLDRGATSRLAVWAPEDGTMTEVATPEGCLGAVGRWTGPGLRIPFSAPDRPGCLARLDPDEPGSWRQDGEPGPFIGFDGADRPTWRPAHLELLVGGTGPVESIVYGGPDWRGAEHVLLALHGGPAAAWRFEFDPLLQRLASAGIAVVAPNQRGSTGYGARFARELHGAWGGPDLADITAIGRTLGAERAAFGLGPPALFGVSYGAYLALLAAAFAPNVWSRALAVAPFLSGPRLIAEASLPVRALMTRLGGEVEYADELGPRDVVAVCERIRVPLLFVHGDRDDTIPVGQSRTLRHTLLRHGRGEGTDFRYLELPGLGHEVLTGDGAPDLHARLTGFLQTGRV